MHRRELVGAVDVVPLDSREHIGQMRPRVDALHGAAFQELATIDGVGERAAELAGGPRGVADAAHPGVQPLYERPRVEVAELLAVVEWRADEGRFDGEEVAQRAQREPRLAGVVMPRVEEVGAEVTPAAGAPQSLGRDREVELAAGRSPPTTDPCGACRRARPAPGSRCRRPATSRRGVEIRPPIAAPCPPGARTARDLRAGWGHHRAGGHQRP